MSLRLRRLSADYERIREVFEGNPFVKVEPLDGEPPERYLVTYRLPGLRWDAASGKAVAANIHKVEIYLHLGYPREKPKCIMRTPIWHPNIGDYVCTADHWAAGETLADVIVQIGDMIQYKSYNTASPVNISAAAWASRNWRRFPIGRIDLLQPGAEVSLSLPESESQEVPIELGPPVPSNELDIRLD